MEEEKPVRLPKQPKGRPDRPSTSSARYRPDPAAPIPSISQQPPRRGLKLPAWIASLMSRRPFKVVAVALANKLARTIWALLVKGGTYRAPPIMAKA